TTMLIGSVVIMPPSVKSYLQRSPQLRAAETFWQTRAIKHNLLSGPSKTNRGRREERKSETYERQVRSNTEGSDAGQDYNHAAVAMIGLAADKSIDDDDDDQRIMRTPLAQQRDAPTRRF